jgi:DNA-binding transcriptional ArsR family regulator
MAGPKQFTNQQDSLTFNREQLLALASTARSQVLWAFNKAEPLSVAEVATFIGKSPQSVHAHVNLLVELGLLIAVETRRKRSREEKAYVHAAANLFTPAPPLPADCVEPMTSAFAAHMRQATREKALAYKVLEKDAAFQLYNSFRIANVIVSEADALAIRNLLHDSIARASQLGGTEGVRVRVAVLMLPAEGESSAWYQRITGDQLRDQTED